MVPEKLPVAWPYRSEQKGNTTKQNTTGSVLLVSIDLSLSGAHRVANGPALSPLSLKIACLQCEPSNWRRGVKSRFFVAKQSQSLLRRDEVCSQSLKFDDGSLSIFRIQSFDRILHDGYLPSPREQTFSGKANAVFGDHAKDNELG